MKTSMKKLVVPAVFLAAALTAFSPGLYRTAVDADYQSGLSRRNTLATTGDPARYSVFTADGNKITAKGFYGGDVVSNFEIVADFRKVSLEFKPLSDGAYTAVFEGIPSYASHAYIRLTMKSGFVYNYRVEYGDGWFFGDNGLADKNGEIVENHTDVGEFLSALYLVNVDGTAETADETLFRIKSLTDGIIAGLENDYDKARAISGWVADNIYYDSDARENDVSLDVIALNRVLDVSRTTCAGYANLTAAMLEAAGIKAVTVIGNAVNISEYETLLTANRHHEWTAFWHGAENRWVMLDSGWDSGNVYKNGKYNAKSNPRKYFDISPLAFSQNHRAEKAEYRSYFSAPLYYASLEETVPETTTGEPPQPTAADEPSPPQSHSSETEKTSGLPAFSQSETVEEPTSGDSADKELPTLVPPAEPAKTSEPSRTDYPEPAFASDLPLLITVGALSAGAAITGAALLFKINKRK
ncbi:MAG: hypothetical protein LBI38_00380 [Oscillospiraceae bacterium]|jgi:transglutaminase-like putative cysteine protease|nr:hypothetical protein [Oscillospiraceae bacterium]